MATNPFDQFDAPANAGANPFDQFDAPTPSPREQIANAAAAVRGAKEVAAGNLINQQDNVITALQGENVRNKRAIEVMNAANEIRKQNNIASVTPRSNPAAQEADNIITDVLRGAREFFGGEVNKVAPQQTDAGNVYLGGSPTGRSANPAQGYSYQTQRGLQANEAVSPEAEAINLARGEQLLQGLTLGFSDEIEGGGAVLIDRITSALEGTDAKPARELYAQARDEARKRIESGSNQLGEAEKLLYQVVGSLPTGLVGSRVATGAGNVLNLGEKGARAAQVAAAATEGALAGQGASTAELFSEQNLADTAIGGAFGAAGGVLGDVLGTAANKLNQSAVFNRNAGTQRIQNVLQDFAEDAQGTDEEFVDSLVRQLDEVAPQIDVAEGANVGVAPTLADISELGDLARASNQQTQLPPETLERLVQRQGQIQENLADVADPVLTPQDGGGTGFLVGGREVQPDELIPTQTGGQAGQSVRGANYPAGSGVTNLDAYSQAARREGNEAAAELYETAYARNATQAQREDLTNFVQNSPTLQSAFRQGQRNATDINLANSIDRKPTIVQLLDETSKVLGNQARNLEAGQSKAALSGLKAELDDRITAIAPELSEARAVAKEGQATRGFVEGGKNAVDSTSIDAVDNFVRTIWQNSPEAEQAALGAGRALREAVFKRASQGGRDDISKKLLTSQQIDNYNRIADRAGTEAANSNVVNQLLDSESRAARTRNIAETKRNTWQQELKNALPTNIRDVVAASSIAALAASPSPIGWALAAGRVGQSAVSRLNNRAVAKQVQNTLYRAMPDMSPAERKKYLQNILRGDFSSVPSKVLEDIGRAVSTGLGVAGAAESAQ